MAKNRADTDNGLSVYTRKSRCNAVYEEDYDYFVFTYIRQMRHATQERVTELS